MTKSKYSSVVVGGGVAGLSIALELSRLGDDVTVFDSKAAKGASWVAAGMLAPASEAIFGDDVMTEFMFEAANYWPTYVAELEKAAHQLVGYVPCGTLVVAHDDGDLAELRRIHEYQSKLGIATEFLTRIEARKLEPLLTPRIAGALHSPQDHQVDNRAFLSALRGACLRREVAFVEDTILAIDASQALELETAQLGRIRASRIFLATGYELPRLNMIGHLLPSDLIRPVKGVTLRLRSPYPETLPNKVIRGFVGGKHCYIVGRPSGEIVVGATLEEGITSLEVDSGAILELLRDSVELIPSLKMAHFTEAIAGLRPTSIDGAPLLGRLGDTDVFFHSAHFRHGILLSPLTARLVAEAALHDSPSPWLDRFTPSRFTDPTASSR